MLLKRLERLKKLGQLLRLVLLKKLEYTLILSEQLRRETLPLDVLRTGLTERLRPEDRLRLQLLRLREKQLMHVLQLSSWQLMKPRLLSTLKLKLISSPGLRLKLKLMLDTLTISLVM